MKSIIQASESHLADCRYRNLSHKTEALVSVPTRGLHMPLNEEHQALLAKLGIPLVPPDHLYVFSPTHGGALALAETGATDQTEAMARQ